MSTGIPWLARLRNLVREAVDQLPDQGRQTYQPAVLDPDPERGPGWFRVRGRLTPAEIESAFDGRLSPLNPDGLGFDGLGFEVLGFEVREVVVTGERVRVRTTVTAPAVALALQVRAGGQRRVLTGLTDGLDAVRDSPLLAELAGKTLTPVAEGPARTALNLGSVPGWDELRPAQQRAVAACCAPGLQLIWGPPGTGKTRVIGAAVSHLARSGQRVLLVSATAVAVDDALHRVVQTLQPEDDEVLRIGSIHRPDLAADDRVNLRRSTENRQSQLLQTAAELQTEIRGLSGAAAALEQARAAVAGFDAADYERTNRRVKNRAAFERQQQDLRPAEAHVFAARNDQARYRRLLLSLTAREAADTERRARAALSALDTELAARGRRIWMRISQFRTIRRLRTRRRELADQLAQARAALARAQEEARRASVTAEACGDRTRDEIETGHHRAIGRLKAAESRLTDVQRELTRLGSLDRATDEDQTAVMEQWRLWELHVRLPTLRDEAEQEKHRRQALERAHAALQQQIAQTGHAIEGHLVATAKVVGTTLAQLALRPWITETPFDHVIVDEAAAAQFPHLVHAVGRARVGATLVGDHLQNGPVLEPNFPDSVPIKNLFLTDCFAYFGATIPRAAQIRPGCVVLSEQFHAGPALTQLANRVAYGNLIENVLIEDVLTDTLDEEVPVGGVLGRTVDDLLDEIVVITVDGLPPGLRTIHREGKARSGWWAIGALLARALADRHRGGGTSETFGVLAPFTAQVEAATAIMAEAGSDRGLTPAGTAAVFQGRRFDTVLADLVEDGEGWIAGARLDGGEYAVTGLRFFTVAATRPSRRLYLLLTDRALQKADGGPLSELQQMITEGTALRVDAGDLLGQADDEPAPEANGSELDSSELDGSELDSSELDGSGLDDLRAALNPYVRVATGPDQDAALDEVIARIAVATTSVWCWNAWTGSAAVSIVKALEQARQRGVDVHLIAQPSDQIEPGNQQALAGLAQRLPQTVFMRDLHQKIVVTDRRWSSIGSTNSRLHAPSTRWRRFMITVPGSAFAEQLLTQEMTGELARQRRCRQCDQPLRECRETGREPNRRWIWVCPNRHSTPFPDAPSPRRTDA